MSGQNRLVLSQNTLAKGSESALTQGLMNANQVKMTQKKDSKKKK